MYWNCCIDACNAYCVNVWDQVSLQISASSVLPMRPTASIYIVPIVVTSTIHRPNLWELPEQCVRRYLRSWSCCQCGLQPPFALWTTSDSDFTKQRCSDPVNGIDSHSTQLLLASDEYWWSKQINKIQIQTQLSPRSKMTIPPFNFHSVKTKSKMWVNVWCVFDNMISKANSV